MTSDLVKETLNIRETPTFSTPIKGQDKQEKNTHNSDPASDLNDSNQITRKKATDNDSVFEMAAKLKKVEENKTQEENNSELSKRLFEDLNLEEKPVIVVKESETITKAGSSHSLNFIQEHQKIVEPNQSLNQGTSNQSLDISQIKNLETKSQNDFSNSSQSNHCTSNNSINSSSSLKLKRSERVEEPLPEWVKLDAYVIVSTSTVRNKTGHIKFIGKTKFSHGTWIGVELEESAGINDGSLEGVRYFTCAEKKGVFVRHDKLTLKVNRDI